jgi:hypothetical protein
MEFHIEQESPVVQIFGELESLNVRPCIGRVGGNRVGTDPLHDSMGSSSKMA